VSEAYQAAVGRTQVQENVVTAAQANALAATLDRDERLKDGDALPPGWHWSFFPEAVNLADTGPDGHAKPGTFFPELPLKRRMWAANKMRFRAPIVIGQRATRTMRIASVTPKDGGTGPLIFVVVQIDVAVKGSIATEEEMTYVFRGPPARPEPLRRGEGPPSPNEPAPRKAEPPKDAQWTYTVDPTPVLLFRFSALTMNSHRIHYDLPYVTQEEGYPGLLVHGPLIHTLLVDGLRRAQPAAKIAAVSVRAASPLYAGTKFTVSGAVNGKSAKLWAVGPSGGIAMSGEVELG
jgi:3-methylfumaryl-CoA hydratase